ncbi:MAG: aminoacyl-tRNA hydrolase [Chitinophagaceae bacterium]
MQKYLIAGLGNVGAEYDKTRHNIGFDVLDALALKHKVVFESDRFADLASFSFKGKGFVCIKPTTFMNLSGRSVRYWMEKESVPVENILVIVDDIALPLNRLRIRKGGSSGGHNGLKSIEEYLKTQDYAKLRFGVGNDFAKGRQADYVLGRWQKEEVRQVEMKVDACVEIVESFALSGADNTMNRFNKISFDL